MRKRLLSTLLALCMALPLLPGTALASEIDSGTCGKDGDNLTWTVDEDMTLTISGKGEMEDYRFIADYINTPWTHLTDENYAVLYIQKVIVENGVTSIGDWAFGVCVELRSIEMPESVTSIGDRAFEWCVRLSSVTIPESVTSIGESAFNHCTRLSSIEMPESVITIGDWAFSNCTSLSSITIPKNVTSIGDYAFYMCPSLSDVYYLGTREQWGEITIGKENFTSAIIHCSEGGGPAEEEPAFIEAKAESSGGGSTTVSISPGDLAAITAGLASGEDPVVFAVQSGSRAAAKGNVKNLSSGTIDFYADLKTGDKLFFLDPGSFIPLSRPAVITG